MYRSSRLRQFFEHGLHYRFGHVWSMYRSSPLRSTLNTGYITGLGMCAVCTEAVHCVALWTSYITGADICEVCTEAVHCVARWTRLHYRFGHVWSMYRSSPLRSTLNTGYITGLGHVWIMYRSSRLRSTLNTGYITGLGMCEVCTEAVDCVALWTRVTLQVWACVKYVPKQSIA